ALPPVLEKGVVDVDGDAADLRAGRGFGVDDALVQHGVVAGDDAAGPAARLPGQVPAGCDLTDDLVFGARPVAHAAVAVDADAMLAQPLGGGAEVVDGDAVPLLDGDVEVNGEKHRPIIQAELAQLRLSRTGVGE